MPPIHLFFFFPRSWFNVKTYYLKYWQKFPALFKVNYHHHSWACCCICGLHIPLHPNLSAPFFAITNFLKRVRMFTPPDHQWIAMHYVSWNFLTPLPNALPYLCCHANILTAHHVCFIYPFVFWNPNPFTPFPSTRCYSNLFVATSLQHAPFVAFKLLP
jgi:hypothetical protein